MIVEYAVVTGMRPSGAVVNSRLAILRERMDVLLLLLLLLLFFLVLDGRRRDYDERVVLG
jgi:hypothetical protein